MRGALVVVATAGLFGCSPYGGGIFVCDTDSQCSQQGLNGTCQSTGFCSFPSTVCPSGQRYGGLAGEQSNLCVGNPAMGDDGGLTEQLDASLIDAAPTSACFGTGATPFVRECLMTAPPNRLDLGDTDINTNIGNPMCVPVVAGGNLDACVLAGSSIHITGHITAHGVRPLVFVASTTIVVDGTIDVASHRGDQLGPSANTTPCPSGQSATEGFLNDGGGGYGGTFAGKGGDGGRSFAGGGGGRAPNPAVPPMLRGGCPGSNGAHGGGARGDGGGALALIANTSITINGTINACGAAGDGGIFVSGGGGGGAGGMIDLDGPTIMVATAAKVFAVGGGGGEAGGLGTGRPGDESLDGTVAKGGAGGAKNGGDGGDGASGAMLNGASGHDFKTGQAGGGGGGGGAAGVIRKFGTLTGGGLVSPPEI